MVLEFATVVQYGIHIVSGLQEEVEITQDRAAKFVMLDYRYKFGSMTRIKTQEVSEREEKKLVWCQVNKCIHKAYKVLQ